MRADQQCCTQMAPRKPPEPQPLEIRKLTPEDIDLGIAKLQRRIDEVKKLRTEGARHDDGRKETAESNIQNTIHEIFGQNSRQFREFEYLTIDDGLMIAGGTDAEYQNNFTQGISPAVTRLEGLVRYLEEQKEFAPRASAPIPPQPARQNEPSRKIFIVHGHDGEAKEATARFLANLDFEPIILHEQANGGRTVIEKFENYSDVAFAVVLLTPDDMASSKAKPGETHERARQNVVLELGFFIGKLGRANVCPLVKGDVEKPSDYDGVVYVPMDAGNGWKMTLAREIRASGLSVDGNKLMTA
jgi:predicted nucleotide-binding protein